ncbi:hypothetical protein J2S97_003043 [Arthrobacter oryzae]|nr:hypothetical protein [Arthrobacter oryzae]
MIEYPAGLLPSAEDGIAVERVTAEPLFDPGMERLRG